MKYAFLLNLIWAFTAHGQSYTYQPMNFDTSCYWTIQVSIGSDGVYCGYEKQIEINGDTLIGGLTYYKLYSFKTSAINTNGPGSCYYWTGSFPHFIREDTAVRRIYTPDGKVVIDFGKQVGDTMDIGLGSRNPTVDSITFISTMGALRRVQWGHFGLHQIYFTLEGVGANFNFPESSFGEWQSPTDALRCFNRTGQTHVMTNSTGSCMRKPPFLSVSQQPQIARSICILQNRSLRIADPLALPVDVGIYDLLGRRMQATRLTTTDAFPISEHAIPVVVRILGLHASCSLLVLPDQ